MPTYGYASPGGGGISANSSPFRTKLASMLGAKDARRMGLPGEVPLPPGPPSYDTGPYAPDKLSRMLQEPPPGPPSFDNGPPGPIPLRDYGPPGPIPIRTPEGPPDKGGMFREPPPGPPDFDLYPPGPGPEGPPEMGPRPIPNQRRYPVPKVQQTRGPGRYGYARPYQRGRLGPGSGLGNTPNPGGFADRYPMPIEIPNQRRNRRLGLMLA